jgi:hypothetical protein
MRAVPWRRKLWWLVIPLLPILFVLTQARNHAAAGVELGQTVEGAGSANFAWLRYPGMQCGVAFRAPRTGTVTEITLPWKSKGGYGAGTFGVFDFELRMDGPEHFPAATAIGSARRVTPREATGGTLDGALRFPIIARLQEGEIYHLIVTNVDPDPRQNWSSPNTLMTRVTPWDGTGCRVSFYADGAWRPWSSKDNPFNKRKVNDVSGARCPLMLRWADGAVTGDPYYSAAQRQGAYFFGKRHAGQSIAWKGPSTTVSRIGLSVWKRGAPGELVYHLEREDGSKLATGILPGAKEIGDIAGWVYADLPAPVELKKGITYRLWFESPDSPDEENCYFQYVPYGDNRPAEWLEGGWGGTASHYIYNDGAGWKGEKTMDLTFSLR